MSMPGFTVEMSLNRTSRYYQTTAIRIADVTRVVPQARVASCILNTGHWQSVSAQRYASGGNRVVSQLSPSIPFLFPREPVYLVVCFSDFVVKWPIPTVWTLANARSTIRSHPLTV